MLHHRVFPGLSLMLLLPLASAVLAQSSGSTAASSRVSVPIALQLGLPQGEFAENVALTGGVTGGVLWNVGGLVGLRADLGVMIYGSERRRVPLGGGALGLISVDVTTTNTIFGGGIGAQVGVPGPRLMPYLGGMIGFSAFTTTSSVNGSNSNNEPFASTTNSSDGTFAKTAYGGLYIPLSKGRSTIDLGVRHTWNGDRVRYLTEGDIVEDVNGGLVITPHETAADLLTITLGVTIRPGGRKR